LCGFQADGGMAGRTRNDGVKKTGKKWGKRKGLRKVINEVRI